MFYIDTGGRLVYKRNIMGTLDNNFYRPVADKIREARKSANLTQKMLAGNIGLTRAAVANIESGRQQILLHTLYNIADACHTDPFKLLPKIAMPQKADRNDDALKKELNKKLPAHSASRILNRLNRT